jgi:hypothetical protein
MEEASCLLTVFDRVKHYTYALWRDLTGHSAAECDLPRLEVESFAAELVNHHRNVADMVGEVVGERESTEFLSDRADPVYRQMAKVLVARWSRFRPGVSPE